MFEYPDEFGVANPQMAARRRLLVLSLCSTESAFRTWSSSHLFSVFLQAGQFIAVTDNAMLHQSRIPGCTRMRPMNTQQINKLAFAYLY